MRGKHQGRSHLRDLSPSFAYVSIAELKLAFHPVVILFNGPAEELGRGLGCQVLPKGRQARTGKQLGPGGPFQERSGRCRSPDSPMSRLLTLAERRALASRLGDPADSAGAVRAPSTVER